MTARTSLALGLAATAVTLLGSMSTAHAQYAAPPRYYAPPPGYGPPPRMVYRSGLVIGFAGGLGAITADNCNPECGAAGLLEGHIGAMVNPRMAVLFQIWGALHPWTDVNGDSRSTSNTFITGALQYWVTNLFWIEGGLGVGYIQTANDSANVVETNESGFALTGAAGIELLQSYNFALDLQFRAGNGFYSVGGSAQNFAIMLGLNWY